MKIVLFVVELLAQLQGPHIVFFYLLHRIALAAIKATPNSIRSANSILSRPSMLGLP